MKSLILIAMIVGCFATQSVAQESNVAVVSGFLKIPQEEDGAAFIRADIILSVFINPRSDGGASVEITTSEVVSQRIPVTERNPAFANAVGGATVNRKYRISFETKDAADQFALEVLQKREGAVQK